MDERGSTRVERALRLERAFYERSTVKVARDLLGKLLVHDSDDGRTVGRIVETEAYLGAADAASHSFSGRTQRNAVMFGPPGHAYVYFIYGVHYCFNVVTQREGIAEAVLVRALEPIEGLDLMRARRGAGRSDRELCNGPGKLAQAMGIARGQNGIDLIRGAIGIYEPATDVRMRARRSPAIVATTRVGITRAAELPLRFYWRDHPHVSKR
jgi:DNA-3-methyladenine glycosylase